MLQKQACQGKTRFLVQTHTVKLSMSQYVLCCGKFTGGLGTAASARNLFFAPSLVIRGHVFSNRAFKLQPANLQFRVSLSMVLHACARVCVPSRALTPIYGLIPKPYTIPSWSLYKPYILYSHVPYTSFHLCGTRTHPDLKIRSISLLLLVPLL